MGKLALAVLAAVARFDKRADRTLRKGVGDLAEAGRNGARLIGQRQHLQTIGLEQSVDVLGQLRRGVDLRGYQVWSLMDNFEWAYGYTKRFGIVHVDYDSLERTIKQSGHWYSELIRSRSIPE